ncbi:hypothetical protein V865_006270 [Kwoniella europaea PYCC6329]|uniref:WW domain-containing protein n=1 Tax=Kwoniella europaea PYCC6329 TaxID=1423913 RepID=A0AAX4KQC2_9TREE
MSAPPSASDQPYRRSYVLYSTSGRTLWSNPSTRTSSYRGSAKGNPEAWTSYIANAHAANPDPTGLNLSSWIQTCQGVMDSAKDTMDCLQFHADEEDTELVPVSQSVLDEYDQVVQVVESTFGGVGSILHFHDGSTRGYVKPDDNASTLEENANRVRWAMQESSSDQGIVAFKVNDRGMKKLPFLI